MSNLTVRTTSTPTEDDLKSFIDLLSTCYQNVPLTTAFITEIDGVSPGTEYSQLSPERLKKHFSLGLPSAFKSNILLTTVSAANSSRPLAAVLFEPPDFSGTPPAQARKQPGPILSQYRSVARALKAKHLAMPDTGPHQWDTPAAPSQASSGPSGDPYPSDFNKDTNTEVRTFYHLALLVRDTDASKQETAQAVKEAMDVYLEKAKASDVPIFLEASSQESKDEFEARGFEAVEQVAVGQGRVDARGWPTEGGDGVKVWGMIYNP
ncbi:hypothetical protein PMZ80_008016 [Knufia obscura]|uniref:Uncharacterized protein n=2 Tax=Knufia TaxID=430999 RepID=A0AAN8EW07_9EURO|nr:hypothetical protein PMZ80_008016 [Knufia obscura]KAK5957255.1 hypothetical protein OHC33_001627 [Knufia fluminis]